MMRYVMLLYASLRYVTLGYVQHMLYYNIYQGESHV